MDITMIKQLSAQIKNKDIDLDLAKDALYRNWIITFWHIFNASGFCFFLGFLKLWRKI